MGDEIKYTVSIEIEKLKKLDKAYYNGEALTSDQEYDNLRKEAKEKYPLDTYFSTIGSSTSNTGMIPWTTEKHLIRMGSISNININDTGKYLIEVVEGASEWYRKSFFGKDILFQYKLDGLSVNLQYSKGLLKNAILRNDGISGEDVYRNIIKTTNIPLNLDKSINNLNGEIVLSKKNLIEINKKQSLLGEKLYSNCRNAAAGIIRRFDGKYSEYLDVIIFSANCKSDCTVGSDLSLLLMLKRLFKVTTIDSVSYNNHFAQGLTIEEMYKSFLDGRDKYPYDTDGVVIKIDSLLDRKDKAVRPNWIRAMKFPPEAQPFKVSSVKWNIGKTGKFTPVAVSDSGVQFEGKLVNRVTLHNYDNFTRLAINRGDTLMVEMSGDVIPKVKSITHTNKNKRGLLLAPEFCLHCGNTLVCSSTGKYIYCPSVPINCSGRAKQLINFWVSTNNMKGIGPGIIAKLYRSRLVRTPADLYTLTAEKLLKVEGIKDKSAHNILMTISASTDTMSLITFLASLGIEGISKAISKKVFKEMYKRRSSSATCPVDLIFELSSLSLAKGNKFSTAFNSILGKKNCNSLYTGLRSKYILALISDLLHDSRIGLKSFWAGFTDLDSNKDTCKGNIYCITGKAHPDYSRKKLTELIDSSENSISSSIKKGSILVTSDLDFVSSKTKKAKKLNCRIITIEELLLEIRGK